MSTQVSEISRIYGPTAVDLILTLYVNFYFSEIEIMDLCGKWIPRRSKFEEKSYLVLQAYDELKHAKLFREGVEYLGLKWDHLNHERYRLRDIDDRFAKLQDSDDELEVLIGLNLYAEGVLALEEIKQLSESKPEYFPTFEEIYRDELTHVAFGIKVVNRLLRESRENVEKAKAYTQWYRDHLTKYLEGDLKDKISYAVNIGFVTPDFTKRVEARFDDIVKKIGLSA